MSRTINQNLSRKWLIIDNNGRIVGGRDSEIDAINQAKVYTISGGNIYFVAENHHKISQAAIAITDTAVA